MAEKRLPLGRWHVDRKFEQREGCCGMLQCKAEMFECDLSATLDAHRPGYVLLS